MAAAVRPYTVAVAQEQLDDLQLRLESARWPAEIEGAGGDYGTDQAFLRSVIDRWTNGYDWRRTEAELNQWGSFTATAAGQHVHLLHARSAKPDAIPIVLTHGWPGSIIEFLDAMPLLQDSFHVVVVSMPGYGFSGPTRERGIDVAAVAAAVADVMAQLGYDRYVAQGGDWGALVTRYLGEHFSRNAVAIHTNMLFALPPEDAANPMAGVSEDEIAAIVRTSAKVADGTAYMDVQATRPHSVGFGLDDSPIGLAGWILEKFDAWCDTRDGMPISIDRLIDNLMMYWLTCTGTSAARLYCESARAGTGPLSPWQGRVDVPTGYAVYPWEILQTPRAWAEKHYNVVHYSHQARGGHFAAFEQPQLFAADLNAYGRLLREAGLFD